MKPFEWCIRHGTDRLPMVPGIDSIEITLRSGKRIDIELFDRDGDDTVEIRSIDGIQLVVLPAAGNAIKIRGER